MLNREENNTLNGIIRKNIEPIRKVRRNSDCNEGVEAKNDVLDSVKPDTKSSFVNKERSKLN